jgi:hypothetical protein
VVVPACGAGERVVMTTWVPQSCTLPTAEQPLRVAEFDELFGLAVRPARRVSPTELRVHLPAGDDVAAVATSLIERETGCCSFFTFDLHRSSGETGLEVRVPESQRAVLDAMQQRVEAIRAGGTSA